MANLCDRVKTQSIAFFNRDLKVGGMLLWVALLGIALSLALLPLRAALLLVVGSGGLLLAMRWPALAWIGLGLTLPFASALKLGPLSAADLLLLGALALWAADGVRRRRLTLAPARLPFFVAIYITALLITLPQAADLGEAAAEVIKWAEVLLVIWVAGQALDRRSARWLVVALLASASVQGMLGLYQFLFRVGPDAFILMDRFMPRRRQLRPAQSLCGLFGANAACGGKFGVVGGESILDIGE